MHNVCIDTSKLLYDIMLIIVSAWSNWECYLLFA